ncbi:hypothetical protein ISR94_03775 [Candidatus Microgenomates bacterium]|nr:hypothetical protein [Candidatus Microgenomates bacterium]
MVTKGSIRRKNKETFQEVITLRKKGHSYSEIIEKTGVAKSTINSWITYAGLNLSPEHLKIQSKKRLENHERATIASKITKDRKRKVEIDKFVQSMKKHLNDPFFVGGIMLYEAEGSKGDSCNFSNSDYRVCVVYLKFLRKYIDVDDSNLAYRLYIHDSRKKDLERVKNYWTKKLSVKKDVFSVSWKHNSVSKKRNNMDYVGQINIGVIKIPYLSRKLLQVSGIILKKYQKL